MSAPPEKHTRSQPVLAELRPPVALEGDWPGTYHNLFGWEGRRHGRLGRYIEGNSHGANLTLVSLSGFPRAPSVKVPLHSQGAAAFALHFITNIHRFFHFRCRISTFLINLEQLLLFFEIFVHNS